MLKLLKVPYFAQNDNEYWGDIGGRGRIFLGSARSDSVQRRSLGANRLRGARLGRGRAIECFDRPPSFLLGAWVLDTATMD